jgi:hypothetical protein
MLTLIAIAAAPQAARADDSGGGDSAKPAPRATVEIGGASIVLIAASDHLYAFVDRVDDNAPVADAKLALASDNGAAIEIGRIGDGLFAAPFDRTGRTHDTFKVSLRSTVATGDARAEIAYDDAPDAESAAGAWYIDPLVIALISGSVGAIASALVVLRLRGGRRRVVVASSAGDATTA